MKIILSILLSVIMSSCTAGKQRSYTGSTPANATVRSFLGISLVDSIDFIRWKLVMDDKKYHLDCNYGIGKPNTKGFWNGGKTIGLSGELKKEKNYYYLSNENKTLHILELNDNLLHLLSNENSLLVGNGGCSYTLCNEKPVISSQLTIIPPETVLKDSMAFVGRTPCPGLDARKECNKLKWSIVFYANPLTNKPAGYRLRGSLYGFENKTGEWTILHGKDGRIIYQLNDAKGNALYYLLKVDENILLFTDANENLLVGNEDFSYTLNRKPG